MAQVGQLAATYLLWRFGSALADHQPLPRRARHLKGSALAVCAASVLTTVPVLVLAPVADLSPGRTRRLADWTDTSDVILFAAGCVLAALVATAAPLALLAFVLAGAGWLLRTARGPSVV